MIGEENKTFKAYWDQNDLKAAIKGHLCKLCNENLCFIKLKQVLNCKVHNLGKTASRFLFL